LSWQLLSGTSETVEENRCFEIFTCQIRLERSETMRALTYGGAVSLDGFLAGMDGALDWLQFSKDVQQVMTDYWKDVDAILMGRKTYEVSVANNPKKSKRAKRTEPTMRTFVFSRTLKEVDYPGVQLVASDAAEFVRRLKQEPGKDICLMGGGELAQSLLAAGLVDKIGLNIHPILLGSGIPTFRDFGHRIKLALTECRTLEGGCILVNYSVSSDAS
jgi:dihydrofolate reductase